MVDNNNLTPAQDEPPVIYGDKDVNLIVGSFAELFGTTKTTRWDRFAAKRMARSDRYGNAEGIVALMKLYHSYSNEKYAPTVGSVSQFEEKLPNVVQYLKKRRDQSEEIQL